jgi:mannose-1-phosphate guanylyltransferase
MIMLIPVIMAGGSGTRLWPMSRELRPKQFQSLTGSETMFQQTLLRLDDSIRSNSIVICNEKHRFLAAEQVRGIGLNSAKIILEPRGRNTAPAIALAALEALNQKVDPLLLVLSADHLITDKALFHQTIEDAAFFGDKGNMVVFGVTPTHAETGFGYIQKGQSLDKNAFQLAGFVEKPDQKTARAYLEKGDYFWNSGMFLFRAGIYITELGKFRPDILKACEQAIKGSVKDLDFIRVDKKSFEACPADSIDYAVMEKTDLGVVVPLKSGWSDIGSWTALADSRDKDEHGNVLQGDVIALDTRNSLVMAEKRLVAALGVDDLVVVETMDAVLVARKDKAQEIKSLVEQLKKAGRTEHITHREVFRPWGSFDSISEGQRYQVKRITVKPGAKLSVQMHHHRAEHWVVVKGTARVQNGDEIILVTENQSTYIPVGQIHSLENPGTIPLELIEVQSGAYLGEDDIVRFEDKYGRNESED